MEQPIIPDNHYVAEDIFIAHNYASTGQRFLNYIIDLIVYYAATYFVGMILGYAQALTGTDLTSFLVDKSGIGLLWRLLFSYALIVVVYTLVEGSTKGYTLGKLITGTKAINENGTALTFAQAFKRSLARLIPFEAFSDLRDIPGMIHLLNSCN